MSNNKKKNFYDICMYASAATLSALSMWMLILNYGGSASFDSASLKHAKKELNKTEEQYNGFKDSLDQEVDKRIDSDIMFQDVYQRFLHKDSTISDYFEFRADPDVYAVDSICNTHHNQVYNENKDTLHAMYKKRCDLTNKINNLEMNKARADSIAQMSTMDRIKGNLRLLKNDLIR